MNIRSLLALLCLMLMGVSCKTPTNVVYFQDVEDGTKLKTSATSQIKIMPKDQLSIIISAQDQRLTDQFNLSQSMNSPTSMTYQNFLGYTVNQKGDIDMPVLGSIHVEGMTREQVAAYIKGQLQGRDLLKDPVVTVNFMNLGVVVMGEVHKPGRVQIKKDKITVLDALAEAGDLTIDGVRDNVLVIRNDGDKQKVYTLDLTKADQVYESPAFYLHQEDVVYVQPNTKAIRNSTENGNTLQTYGFWTGLASFLLSIGILIFRR